jgi:hypothetical protein
MFSKCSKFKEKSVQSLSKLLMILIVFAFSGCRDSLLDTKALDEPLAVDVTPTNRALKDQFFKIPEDVQPNI